MLPTFDMDALRALVAGCDLGSFARAAARLGRSQSAVSMQLKKLEQQAGQRLFRRSGRGLALTEAGDALLAYARRIVALNDEAAASLGATAAVASVRIGLPQDFAEDVLPEVLKQFYQKWPGVHVEVRCGRNYSLAAEISESRLDVAITFARPDADSCGDLVARLPMLWLGSAKDSLPVPGSSVPLVVFDHPCLFRQAAMEALEAAGLRWRLALTTPSLPGVWAALRAGMGFSVRTGHYLAGEIGSTGRSLDLPALPEIDVRLLTGIDLSPAASDLGSITRQVIEERLEPTSRGASRPHGRGRRPAALVD